MTATQIEITYPADTDPLPLYYRRPGECEPARHAALTLDCEATPPRLYLECGRYPGDGTPEAEWHGRVWTWHVDPYLSPADCRELLDTVAPLAERVIAGYSCKWDGSNHVGHLDADATDAEGDIRMACDRAEGDGSWGVWLSYDWICGVTAADLINPGETLPQAVVRLEAEARAECVYLDDDLELALRQIVARDCPDREMPADDADWGAWVRAQHGYRVTASYEIGGQVVDCSQAEVLGEAYGRTYSTREEAASVAEDMQLEIAEYDLDPTTHYSVEEV